MRRAVIFVAVAFAVAVTGAAASGAAPNGQQRSTAQAADRVCANLIKTRNRRAYASLKQWVWTIPNGCVFTRDRPRPAGCTADPDLGCAAPPDVHVRYQHRDYVFHLTLRRVPANAKGIVNPPYNRFLVAHDGLSTKRQRLFIEFSAAEFDGILQSRPSQGQPDIGPELRWRIMYTIDAKKGLCCPRVDPGGPNISPFDVAPERVRVISG
jgi:hypothetical protein